MPFPEPQPTISGLAMPGLKYALQAARDRHNDDGATLRFKRLDSYTPEPVAPLNEGIDIAMNSVPSAGGMHYYNFLRFRPCLVLGTTGTWEWP